MPPKKKDEPVTGEAYVEVQRQSCFVSPEERERIAHQNDAAYRGITDRDISSQVAISTPASSVKSGSRAGGSAKGGRGSGIFQQKVQAKGGIHDSHNKGARCDMRFIFFNSVPLLLLKHL